MEGLGKQYLPLQERLEMLLDLSAKRLKIDGRLVCLLPLPAAADAEEVLPLSRLPSASIPLKLERVSRQPLSLRMHRLMLTLVKVAEPSNVVEQEVRAAEERPDAKIGADAWKQGAATAPWDEWWS